MMHNRTVDPMHAKHRRKKNNKIIMKYILKKFSAWRDRRQLLIIAALTEKYLPHS